MNQDPYRKIARWYDSLFESMNSGLRLIGMKMCRPKAGMSVLDIGCGTGAHLELYKRLGCKLFGIDSSAAMLQIARRRLGDQAELYLGDASAMPYPDRSFDLAMSSLVLHEMPHPIRSAVLNEIKRVIKSDGRILLIDFNPGPAQPLKGWGMRLIILFSELAAGREHFKNFRDFISRKGLVSLMAAHQLLIENEKVVGSGNMAIVLARWNSNQARRNQCLR